MLAFVAPVLDNATRARGQVSGPAQKATFPISTNTRRLKSTTVTGAVLFQDTEFVAGPIANQLFDLIGLTDRPSDQAGTADNVGDRRPPCLPERADHPLGQFSAITMDGWVDFDRNLALKASVPLLPTMWANRPDLPVINGVLGGLRVTVPISGTLCKAGSIARRSTSRIRTWARLSWSTLQAAACVDLLQRLFPPRDRNAPPPRTPAERRAQRQQRRQERQMQP